MTFVDLAVLFCHNNFVLKKNRFSNLEDFFLQKITRKLYKFNYLGIKLVTQCSYSIDEVQTRLDIGGVVFAKKIDNHIEKLGIHTQRFHAAAILLAAQIERSRR